MHETESLAPEEAPRYGLTFEEAQELPLHVYLRHVMIHHGEDVLWDAARVLKVWEGGGWDFTDRHSYPLNVAGNALTRLHSLRGVVRVERGVYAVNPYRLADIQWEGLKRVEGRLRPSVLHKVTPKRFR